MINYGIIDKSIEYYSELGYTRLEVPWLVSKEIDELTKPNSKVSYEVKHNNKCLVGSAEQGFLYQYLKGFLPKGKFQAVTPCFRADTIDILHRF